ncbi:winged helix-turn-helix transcriptional regulator [Candidatus Woesearchaeota archaeon]|nr:winged helix-turn-helix transcriptional regulator [Candidatus Woesearchaeota archaeon]
MAKETFMLVSLQEAKAKKLAQVLSNETSRQILDLLAKGDKTESQIAKELDLPISTVHYNMKHLMQARLVKADEFHYSEKGKEVLHYSLTNQFVVIAPTSEEGMLDRLKRILPVFGFVIVGAGIVGLLSRMFTGFGASNTKMQTASLGVMAERSADAVAPLAAEAGDMAAAGANAASGVPAEINIIIWFLAGSFFALITYLIWEYVYTRVRK